MDCINEALLERRDWRLASEVAGLSQEETSSGVATMWVYRLPGMPQWIASERIAYLGRHSGLLVRRSISALCWVILSECIVPFGDLYGTPETGALQTRKSLSLLYLSINHPVHVHTCGHMIYIIKTKIYMPHMELHIQEPELQPWSSKIWPTIL